MLLTPELVALTIRAVRDDGPEPRWTPLSDQELNGLVDRIEREAGNGPLSVFAYGSLIWNPGFEPISRERAVAYGWHRAFSLKIERWRATSDQPGLMMVLERGGQCDGLLLELAADRRRQDLRALIAREIKYREVVEMVHWIPVKTVAGTRRVLTFWTSTKRAALTRALPISQTVAMIATACGQGGSCAEYLRNTIVSLDAEGIKDRNLVRLQGLVAQEILKREAASRRLSALA